MADAHCSSLGIPEHLHSEGRSALPFTDGNERLYRRFELIAEAEITACFKFNEMSVNRGSFSTAEETLLKDDDGGHYERCGVIEFTVSALHGEWTSGQGTQLVTYTLRPTHVPKRCNFAHAEIVALKNGQPQTKIKPPTVKLAIRRDLRKHIRVCLPVERAGEQLPLNE